MSGVMSGSGRPPLLGIRHVALFVADLETAERFWVEVMGYGVEWRPDPDNVYLTIGADNLALHRRVAGAAGPMSSDRLDHIGLAVPNPDDVDLWAARLAESGVVVKAAPRTHRDGSRSLYFRAPDGSDEGPDEGTDGGPLVQIIYHRPLSK